MNYNIAESLLAQIGDNENMTADATLYYTRPNATIGERLAIGGTYCLFSATFLFLHISILIVFFTYKDYYANRCYRIMMVISIVDSVQLFVHFYGGIIAITNCAFNYWLEKILGGLLNSFCIVLFSLCLVLSIDRLLVYLPHRIIKSHNEKRLIAVLIFLSFAWSFPFFVAYMTPHTGIVFRNYAWDYEDSNPPDAEKWTFVQTIDESSTMPILGATFVIYMLILGLLIYKRRSKMSRPENGATILMIAPHEKRLLIQSLIQFWLELSLNTLWLFQAFELIRDFPLNEAAINLYWIFFNGIKPILYLVFNAPIRERTVRLWLCQGAEKLATSSSQLMMASVHPAAQFRRKATFPQMAARVGPMLTLSARPGTTCGVGDGTARSGRFQMDKQIRFSNGQIEFSNNNSSWNSGTSRSAVVPLYSNSSSQPTRNSMARASN